MGGSTKRTAVTSSEAQFQLVPDDAVLVVMETSKGTVRFVLYPQYAPLAVTNFCTLAQQGYYNGTLFHRVVAGFVVQGGDPGGTGLGGDSIWGQPFATEYSDFLHHYSGALCMATANGEKDTHLSQFYVVATPQDGLDDAALQKMRDAGIREEVVEAYRQAGGAPYLDYTGTVFGQVLDGMDVIDAIARVGTDENNHPKSPVTLDRVTVLNFTAPL